MSTIYLLQPCVDAAFQDLSSHHVLDMLHRVLTSKHELILLHEPYQSLCVDTAPCFQQPSCVDSAPCVHIP